MTTTAGTTSTATRSGDRIEEQVLLPVPRARVWRALTTAEELGAWFGARLTGGTVAPGTRVVGPIALPGYEHLTFDVTIEEMVPEQRFAWRWHPNAIEAGVDYSAEPCTLVTFTLEDAPDGGTLLRVEESGFAALPVERRAAAFQGTSSGWRGQLHKRLPAYLASA
jgi:uncharacterized protein YndB with AHSA1/START domain